MSSCRSISNDLPDRRFNQWERPPPSEPLLDLFDTGNFSPGPNLLDGSRNVSKSGKRLASSMQENQIVMACSGECLFRGNPVGPLLKACKTASCLSFGKVAILSFVVLHACFSDKDSPILELAHDIRQIVMGFVLKGVADGKGSVFGNGQSVRGCKWRANITASVTNNLGIVFKPEQESFFELATKWLPDTPRGTCLEAGNPS